MLKDIRLVTDNSEFSKYGGSIIELRAVGEDGKTGKVTDVYIQFSENIAYYDTIHEKVSVLKANKVTQLSVPMYAFMAIILNKKNTCNFCRKQVTLNSQGINILGGDYTEVKKIVNNDGKGYTGEKYLNAANEISMAMFGSNMYSKRDTAIKTDNKAVKNKKMAYRVEGLLTDNRGVLLGVVVAGKGVVPIHAFADLITNKGVVCVSASTGRMIKVDDSTEGYDKTWGVKSVRLCYDGVNGGNIYIDDIRKVSIVNTNIPPQQKIGLVQQYERITGKSLGKELKRQIGMVG